MIVQTFALSWTDERTTILGHFKPFMQTNKHSIVGAEKVGIMPA